MPFEKISGWMISTVMLGGFPYSTNMRNGMTWCIILCLLFVTTTPKKENPQEKKSRRSPEQCGFFVEYTGVTRSTPWIYTPSSRTHDVRPRWSCWAALSNRWHSDSPSFLVTFVTRLYSLTRLDWDPWEIPNGEFVEWGKQETDQPTKKLDKSTKTYGWCFRNPRCFLKPSGE